MTKLNFLNKIIKKIIVENKYYYDSWEELKYMQNFYAKLFIENKIKKFHVKYVCMYVCVLYVCMYVCMYVRTYLQYTYVYTYTIHMYTHTRTNTRTHTGIYKYTGVYIQPYRYVAIHTYRCIYKVPEAQNPIQAY